MVGVVSSVMFFGFVMLVKSGFAAVQPAAGPPAVGGNLGRTDGLGRVIVGGFCGVPATGEVGLGQSLCVPDTSSGWLGGRINAAWDPRTRRRLCRKQCRWRDGSVAGAFDSPAGVSDWRRKEPWVWRAGRIQGAEMVGNAGPGSGSRFLGTGGSNG